MAHDTQQPSLPTAVDAYDPPLLEGFLELAGILWRRKWLLVLGTLLGVGLGTLAYFFMPVTYETEARMVVVRKWPRAFPMPGINTSMTYLEDYLSTHEALLKSPLIVERALNRAKLSSLESLQSDAPPEEGKEPDPVGQVIGGLSVSRDAANRIEQNNAVLNISYQCSVPEDCPVVLDAVIDQYRQYLDESHRKDSESIRELFLRWKRDVQRELESKQKAYLELRDRIPADLWQGDGPNNLLHDRLRELRNQHLQWSLRQAQAEQQRDVLRKARKEGVRSQVLADVVFRWLNNDAEREPDFRQQLSQLMLEKQSLAETYGTDHPALSGVEERIRMLKELYIGAAAAESREKMLDFVEAYAQYLDQEAALGRGLERTLDAMVEGQHVRVKQSDAYAQDVADLRDGIDRARDLHQELISRLQEVDVLKEPGSIDATVIAPPGPGKPVIWCTPQVIFVGTTFFGPCLGGCFVLLAEIRDKSFRHPEEVQRVTGAPIIGHIPRHRPTRGAIRKARRADASLSPRLCVHHTPHSAAAEAYRGVQAFLRGIVPRDGGRVVQITSPRVGDGKSTLAANLAVAMANAGKATLLIDADLRTPSLHALFGQAETNGLAQVLAGETSAGEAFRPSGITNLDVLPCGDVPAHPAELLASPRFEELLAVARRRYAWVVVDTPPLLAVSDPCVVAPLADGVVLTLRNSKQGRPSAARAQRVLKLLHLNVLGIVLNDLTHQNGFAGYDYPYTRRNGKPRRTRPLISADEQ